MRGLAWVAPLIGFAGCIGGGSAADVQNIEVALGAAIAISQPAQLALAGATGSSNACVQVTTACTTYPCAGQVAVNVGPDCPLPLGTAVNATATVTGNWTSADAAKLAVNWSDAAAGARNTVVVKATDVDVSRSTNSVTVTYTGQAVNVRGTSALAAQSSWTIHVDTKGTADPSDDKYTVDGAQQAAGGLGGGQLSLTGVVVDPTVCAMNPIAGSATFQQVSGLSIKQFNVAFHAACDGMVDVTGTTGGKSSVAFDTLP